MEEDEEDGLGLGLGGAAAAAACDVCDACDACVAGVLLLVEEERAEGEAGDRVHVLPLGLLVQPAVPEPPAAAAE